MLLRSGVEQGDPLTEQIIGCAIEVHRHLGAGLLERSYTLAMCVELANSGIGFDREPLVPLVYKSVSVGEYRPDLVIEGEVVVEVKSVLHFEPVFTAQMLTYLRITGLKNRAAPQLQPSSLAGRHQALHSLMRHHDVGHRGRRGHRVSLAAACSQISTSTSLGHGDA